MTGHATQRWAGLSLRVALLALPALPGCDGAKDGDGSADPVLTRAPRLYWFTTGHGGAFESNMFPSQSLLTTNQAVFASTQAPGSGCS